MPRMQPSISLYLLKKDIRNKNSLFRKACRTLDLGTNLGINFRGGRNFLLKKFVDLEEKEIEDRIGALDD